MKILVLVAVGAVGLAAAAARAAAPQAAPAPYQPPDYLRKAPELPARFADGAPVWKLGLAEALELSVRRNLALALQREQVVATATGELAARAVFQPLVAAQVNRSDVDSPPLTAQEGSPGQVLHSVQDSWSLSVAQHVKTGADLRLDFAGGRSDSNLGTAVEPRIYRSTLGLSLTQPLLRDFSWDGRIQTINVLRARFGNAAALEDARLRAMLTVKATEDAYWTLVQSWKSWEVTVESLTLAHQQVDLTGRQIAAGLLPDSDLTGAEGTLAQRELALVQAETQIQRASDGLRSLLNLPPDQWSRPILPTDMPRFMPLQLGADAALERALTGRPEFRKTHLDLRRVALDLDVARNARLPRLDVHAGAGTVGQDQAYATTLSQVGHGNGRQWNVGLALAWSPLNDAAHAELRRLESVLRQTDLTREQLVVDMRSQVRDAVRAVETAGRQVLAAAKFRELAERSLDIEQRRFLNGLSSNFFIAQREADVEAARLAELSALIEHERAASGLLLATGEILEAHRLSFVLAPGERP